jgi:N-acetylmuramoyl-L-alanine amidase-like protein
MVYVMAKAAPARSDGRTELVSRRWLLRLAGGAGLAALVSGCWKSVTTAAAGPSPFPTRPPPAPKVPPTPAPRGASGVLLCRDAWGARPARAGGRPHTITRMTLHHTGVVLGDDRNSPSRLRQHQRYHQDELGWIDIAYHVGVNRNGKLFELRAPELAGDTNTNYDTAGHFLVVCEGNFEQEAVTEAQLHGAAFAFAWAAQTFGITSNTLAGHRDVARATACPGASLYAHVSSGDLKRRIDDLLAAGTVNLLRGCGPDAAATVAAIEAGH